jgi:hypothetical protein
MTSDRTGRPIHQGPPSGSAVRHLTQPCLVGHGLTYAFKNRYCSFARTLTATSKGMHTMRLEAARNALANLRAEGRLLDPGGGEGGRGVHPIALRARRSLVIHF